MTSPAEFPARELDARVAREVCGIPDWLIHTDRSPQMLTCPDTGRITGPVRAVDFYSTDLRAMGTVLDALRERGWEFNIESSESGWTVSAFPESIKQRMVSADDPSLPRAVALAALAAVGGK